jgi:hypothetical protein
MRPFFSFPVVIPVLAFALLLGACTAHLQTRPNALPLGEKIAFWAETFVGTPYDPDPLGEYVRRDVIIADERVDCMYLTFRAVELAMSRDPGDAPEAALDMRFMHRGKVEHGKVVNYDDRFQTGEGMLESGKWGREVTSELGHTRRILTPAGKEIAFVPAEMVTTDPSLFRSGDIVFFVNKPEKMAEGIVIGHIGILKREKDGVYLIHASGRKGAGGMVKKILFRDYLLTMPFAGIRVSRLGADAQ